MAATASAPTAPRPNPRTLTTLPEILASLSSLESEEAELSTSLSELLSNQEPIANSLTRIQSLVPRLNELYSEATLLSGTVTATAKTADRVGGRVRSLDEEMRRVREAGERVGQVMELKVRHSLCSFASRFILDYTLGFIGSATISNGGARLGVRYKTLRARHGVAFGRDIRTLRRNCGCESIHTSYHVQFSLTERSLLQNTRCRLHRVCRQREKSCLIYSVNSLRRPRRRAMLLRRAATSNCSLP